MSYRIQYGPKLPQEKRSMRLPIIIFILAAVIFASSFAIKEIFPTESDILCRSLFPWTRPDVKEAIEVMIEDLAKGEGLKDAATAFCNQILHQAGYVR